MPEIHRTHSFLQRVVTHTTVVGGERPVTKHRIVKQVDCGHGYFQVVRLACSLEPGHDSIPFTCSRINWNQIVVVEIDAHRADFRQQSNCVDGRKRRTYRVAKWISTAIAYRPESKSKLVLRSWCKSIVNHGLPLLF